MKKARTWVIVLIILGVLVGGGYWIAEQQRRGPEVEILRSAQVNLGTLEIGVPASGTVVPANKANLRFATSGLVTYVGVEPNTAVSEGQLLASLDRAALERSARQARIALEQAELSLNRLTREVDPEELELARIAVQSAAQALEVARIGRQVARVDADALTLQAERARESALRRYYDLLDQDREQAERQLRIADEQVYVASLNAEVVLQQAEERWAAAVNQYRQATQALQTLETGPTPEQIRQAELQVEQAKLGLDEARQALENTEVRAPFRGIVATINVQEEQPVSSGQTAFVLVDDAEFYVDVAIDEIDIGKVAVGQTARVTLDAFPDTPLAGAITSISPAPTTTAGLTAYRVRLRLEPPDQQGAASPLILREGLTANVTIRTQEISDVLLIPNWAIRVDQNTGETYCLQLIDGTPVRTPLALGERGESFTEVRSGLDAQATVVAITESRTLFGLGGRFRPGMRSQ